MSHLRDIMQKLGQRHGGGGGSPSLETSPANGAEQELHRHDYRQQLEACNEPMLLYEWAWQQQHLEDLRLCATNPAMLEVAGGQRHLEALLSATEAAQKELKEVFATRGLMPRRLPHSLAPTEHAWEVTHQGIRAQWGLDQAGGPG